MDQRLPASQENPLKHIRFRSVDQHRFCEHREESAELIPGMGPLAELSYVPTGRGNISVCRKIISRSVGMTNLRENCGAESGACCPRALIPVEYDKDNHILDGVH